MLKNDDIFVEVTDKKIDLGKLLEDFQHHSQGAQILFNGVVRNTNLGKKVHAVSYDVFVPLAEETFFTIAKEALEKAKSPLKVVLIHRMGKLFLGESSVAILVGSPHRDDAYVASRYIIEQIKVRSPIWKKEHYDDEDSQWLAGHTLKGT